MVTLDAGRTYTIDQTVHTNGDVSLINGNGATIHRADITDADYYGSHTLNVLTNAGVRITDLTFSGLHAVETGWTQAQMSAIYVHANSGTVEVDHCTFEDLVGFQIISGVAAGSYTLNFHHNTITNCGNGVNPNMDGEYAYNTFTDAEGFEIAASNVWLHHNTFTRCLSAAAGMGGSVSGLEHTNIVVEYNEVYGCTGNGISFTHGCRGAIARYNTVEDCAQYGITVHRPGSYATTVEDTEVRNNTVRGSGLAGIKSNQSDGTVTGTIIDGNTIEGGGAAPYGLQLGNPSDTVTNNVANGSGVNYDVLIAASGAGMTFALEGEANENTYNTLDDNRP